MHQSRPLSIGRDGHQESRAVADVAKDHDAEVSYLGSSGTRQGDLEQGGRTRQAKATPLVLVYEAGPWGSWRARDLVQTGHRGWVVAPSWIPPKAGDRVNTDRREAVPLARRRRSGDRPPVEVPQAADAAIRDRTRAREPALGALKAAQCRLNAVRLSHDSRYTGRAAWGPAPLRWLADVVRAPPAQQLVCQADGRAITAPTERLQRLEHARPEPVHTGRVPPLGEALQALRGVPVTVAVTRVAARGDLTRVDKPPPLLNSRGLLPAAYASGERQRQGTMTKAGQTPARRVLVEGAWASR